MNNTEWKKVKLGDICILKNGYSFKSGDYDTDGSGKYKIITIKNVQGNRYVDLDKYDTINILPTNIQSHQILKHGDILVSMTGNVGRVSMVNEDNLLLNQRVGLLQIQSELDTEFLYQILSTGEFEHRMTELGHGGAQPNIGKSDIEGYGINIPTSIEEQRRIASLLSRFDELIQLHEFKADNLIKAKQQIMTDIFSGGLRDLSHINPDDYVQDDWVTVKLGDIFKLTRGKVLKASDTIKIPNGETLYPVYSSQTNNNGVMGYYNQYLFENAIIWTTDGAYAGTFRYVKEKFYCTNVCGVMLNTGGLCNQCIAEILNRECKKYVVKGGNPKLMNNVVAGIEVKIPPTLDEQQKIANLLSSYDSLIELKQSQKQQVTNMKQQLMNQLISNGGGGAD